MQLKPLSEQMMLLWLDDDEVPTKAPSVVSPVNEAPAIAPLVDAAVTIVDDDSPPEPVQAGDQSKTIDHSVAPVLAQYAAHVWPKLEMSCFNGLSGAVTKFEANVTAINLLRQLEDECREPTEAERVVLNRYTGWGGLPQAFNQSQSDQDWAKRSADLEALLKPEEHTSAEASTPNAHYTSLEVIEAMWAMVEKLGFKGGRILEPAAGTGYFIGGMPQAIAQNSRVTAVELDELSARFMRVMYGKYDVDVLNQGFEKCRLPDGYFDLAIGNVPFGNYQVPELRNVPYQNFAIHDYFFSKSMDLVRPGGLVAFITSSGTLDKHDNKVRRYLGSKASLVAAIKLPNTAFKKIASTDVTTDILIFQKPLAGKPDRTGWTDVYAVNPDSPLYGKYEYNFYPMANEYFHANPQNVIGKLQACSNGYGKTTGCVFDGDLEAALQERVDQLPEGVYASQAQAVEERKVIALAYNEEHRAGFRLIDGEVYQVQGNEAVVYTDNAKALSRIAGLIQIRDAIRKLVNAQPVVEDEEVLKRYRVGLNVAYDAFVSKHGYIHEKMNRRAFKEDPDLPLLLSLEFWDDEKQAAEKADIFERRTVGVFKRIDHCETPQEALLVTISESGRVIPKRIAELVGKSVDSVMKDLEDVGAVFLNPDNGYYETHDEYLSGNVRDKLALARVSGTRFAKNVTALETVLPADLAPHEISARIGSTWIPSSDYAQFLNETFDGDSNIVSFSSITGSWDCKFDWRSHRTVASTQNYGTSRAPATELFVLSLNQMTPTIKDQDPHDRSKYIVNQVETMAAREKQHDLKAKFVEWLWSDDVRSARLVRLYNDIFNSTVNRRYDGSHLVLPGFSQVYQLHTHQGNAIWRVVSSGKNTLLAHAVGAGKTLEMICAGMELRRLGKASKVLYVVPNHMLQQFASEFLRAYPGAKLLLAGKDDLQGDKRRALLSRIATGIWDGVLITHASFERIKMSDEFLRGYIKQEVEQIEDAIRAEGSDRGNRIVKDLNRAKKTWEARLEKLSGADKKDDLITFEELGVDFVMVDEAHLFKNLFRFSKMGCIAGLPNNHSERSFDLFVKSRYIMEKHNDVNGVVFATGTPVSNSMAELWVMQRYLQHKTLEKLHIGSFDTWAANFGESVTALELSPEGSGYRMHTRFARFVNIPELMSIFREIADIQTEEMLDLPVPNAKRETITAEPTPELKEYIKGLVKRAEDIRNGYVRPDVDNMLAVTNDGRKAALDIRMFDEAGEDFSGSKINLCVNRVFQIWQDTASFKGTQLIFSDLATPKPNGFSAYTDIRAKLVALGVPEEEVAFIHDFDTDIQKATLFKSVREGRVRVLIGSTSKMGVGTNVQTRLVALHHLDLPWRPADMTQRDGRIVRQGNLNDDVLIFVYVTAGSFDAYMASGLERKQRFIAQIMSGDGTIRTMEDVAMAALTFAEIKALASGNPLVMEKAGVDGELLKLSVMKSQWEKQTWGNKNELSSIPRSIERTKEIIEGIERDIASREDLSGNRFAIEVLGVTHTNRDAAGEALIKAKATVKKGSRRKIGSISGFPILVDGTNIWDSKKLVLDATVEYHLGEVDLPVKALMSVLNAYNGMESELENQQDQLARKEKRMADIIAELGKPFEKEDRLKWLMQRQAELDDLLDISKGENAAIDEADAQAEAVAA